MAASGRIVLRSGALGKPRSTRAVAELPVNFLQWWLPSPVEPNILSGEPRAATQRGPPSWQGGAPPRRRRIAWRLKAALYGKQDGCR